MSKVLFVAPHPDDETLGAGGTIFRHKAEGDAVYWLIVSAARQQDGYSADAVETEAQEIAAAASRYRFDGIHQLGLPTARLETLPVADVVAKISEAFAHVQPEIVYLPYAGDIHTDHAVVFAAASSCTKWFRSTSVKRVLVYETPSETDAGLDPDANGFRPNVFVDISRFVDQKIQTMSGYATQYGVFPFPRSERALRSLAAVRGAAAGFEAAEAFMLLRERV
jgi:LmbE family N-acetylglucosaminyl deacetylase